MWPRSDRNGCQRQERPFRSGGPGSISASSPKPAPSLIRRSARAEAAACEHREMVAGTEGKFGDQHVPAAAPQLLDRDHSEPQLETERLCREAPGPDQRGRDGGARRGRDQEGRAIAAEREGQLQAPGWH